MSEALGVAPAREPEGQPDLYNGKTFDSEKEELNFLQRLQTLYPQELEGVKWDQAKHFPRMRELEEQMRRASKQNQAPTQEQINRFYELSRLQTIGGPEWTPELQKEIAELYPLMNRQN